MKVRLALVCAAFVAHAVWLRCVAEDAFITYRFARNLAEGHGFVWNPGEPPVEGFTNFLWVVISAAAYRLGLDLSHVTQILGALAGLGTLLVSWRFAREILGMSSAAAMFTTAMLALCGPLAAWATSGMETVFFTLWITTGVYFASRCARTPALRDAVMTAVSLLLATLTRPEGFGVAAIVLLAACWLWPRREAGRGAPLALIAAAVYYGAFALYFAWRYATPSGTRCPTPSTRRPAAASARPGGNSVDVLGLRGPLPPALAALGGALGRGAPRPHPRPPGARTCADG